MFALVRRCLLLAALLLALPLSAHANEKAAGDFISNIGNQVVTIVSDSKSSPAQRDQKLNSLFKKHVDIQWIGRFVLGRHFRTATDEQKKRYLAAYEGFVIQTYTARFNEYTGEKLQVSSTRKEEDGDVAVDATIVRPKAENISVQFMIRFDKKNTPMIFDVIIEGVSQLNTQRSEFDSIVARNGMDGLIERLESRKAMAPASGGGSVEPAF